MKIYNINEFNESLILEKNTSKSIVDALEHNYCEFYYKKINGEKRHAFGTLKPKFLETVWEPSEEKYETSDDYIVYWDIQRKAFRQFAPENFIKFVNKIELLKDFIKEYPKLEKKIKRAKDNFEEEKSEE